MTALWLGIVFVAILFAILSVKRNLIEVEERENSRTLHSGYLSDPPIKRELGDPPPNPDLLQEQPPELVITKNEVIELKQKAEPIEIEMIDLELDLRLSEKPEPDF